MSESNIYRLKALYTGKVSQRYGFDTAIDKRVITQPLYLSMEGLEGDECADNRHHGGLERALHQYPSEHYQYWRELYPSRSPWQAPGMGEKLSSTGMTEHNVYIGDQYQWGEAIIEVSQPRSPCFKLNKRWDLDGFAEQMQVLSFCGWLYRVIQPGVVSVEQPLSLLSRVNNGMSVFRVCQYFFADPLNQHGLLRLSEQTKLSTSWMRKVKARIHSQQVEDWHMRLSGPGYRHGD